MVNHIYKIIPLKLVFLESRFIVFRLPSRLHTADHRDKRWKQHRTTSRFFSDMYGRQNRNHASKCPSSFEIFCNPSHVSRRNIDPRELAPPVREAVPSIEVCLCLRYIGDISGRMRFRNYARPVSPRDAELVIRFSYRCITRSVRKSRPILVKSRL
jgi:hypothetical protein